MSSNRLIGSRVILSIVQSTVSMLQQFFIPQVRKMRSIVFQQDGAPPHFTADVRRFLDKTFAGRWIGRNGPIWWGPRSSDLTPLDGDMWKTSSISHHAKIWLNWKAESMTKSSQSHKKLYMMFSVIFGKVCLSWWWPLSALAGNELIWNKT